MTRFIHCSRCGRPYKTETWMPLCPDCSEKDEKEFQRIKEYIHEHPGVKIFELVSTLDISVAKIKRYLREERLEIMEKNHLFLKCETCGKPISSGYHCVDCFRQVSHDYKVVFAGNPFQKTKPSIKYNHRR